MVALVASGALPAAAQSTMKDVKTGVYIPYTSEKINVRVDKIERVLHNDGNVLAKPAGPGDGTTGYLIFTMSVQNAGTAPVSFPRFRSSVVLDDQSQVEDDLSGPYVGAGTADGPANLQPKQTVHVRFTVFGVAADRTVTKIILDPNDGAPKLRFQIRPGDIATLPDIPLPAAQ